MASKELIEKVARSICDGYWDAKDFNGTPNGESPDDFREYWKSIAEAAISTILSALQEPTDEMFEAGHETLYEGDYDATMNFALEPAWRAMLNASALGEHSE